MTQIEFSRAGEITPEMKEVAAQEGLKPENIVELVKKGEVVILCNQNHQNVIPTGIGKGLSTKVNANIGTSVDVADLDQEIEKARVAVKAGAHAIMDLSTGGDLREIRQTDSNRNCTHLSGCGSLHQEEKIFCGINCG